MKIAIICDWLVVCGGAERVLAEILTCYPDADLFAVNDFIKQSERGFLRGKPVKTTFVQNLPFSRKYYRAYLPFMPFAIEQLDLAGYDLIISTSHAVAKGVISGPGQVHVSYVYSPMRYAWDLQGQYLRESGLSYGLKGWLVRVLLYRLRQWDQLSAQRPDHLIAISSFIAKRIAKTWRRSASVIFPPVDTKFFKPGRQKDDFYVTASRFVPYKKIDLIVKSFNKMPNKKLIIIGDGPGAKKIKLLAGQNISFIGHVSSDELRAYLQRARAFVFAAEEDFGIAPLEATACGTPVIAYGRGGALETIRDIIQVNPTGVFFMQQTVQSLCQAVDRLESNLNKFNQLHLVAHAAKFSPEVFRNKFMAALDAILSS